MPAKFNLRTGLVNKNHVYHSTPLIIHVCLVFQGEESNSAANKCMLKVAQHAAQLQNYERAIQIYEQVTITVSLSRRSDSLVFCDRSIL